MALIKLGNAKLFYVFFIVLLIVSSGPLLAFTLNNIRNEKHGFIDLIGETQSEVAVASSRNLRLFFDSVLKDAYALEERISSLGADTSNVLRTLFPEGEAGDFPFRAVSILDSDGRVVESVIPGAELAPELDSNSNYALESLPRSFPGGKAQFSGVYENRALRSIAFDILVPLGRLEAPSKVLALTMKPNELLWLLTQSPRMDHNVSVIDTRGNYLIKEMNVPRAVLPINDYELMNQIRSQPDGHLRSRSVGTILYSPGKYQSVSPTGWTILVTTPEEIVAERVESLIRANFSLLLLTFLVVAVVSAFLSRFVALPISRLVDVAKEVSMRNYAPAIVKTVPRVYEEVGKIAGAFGHMIESVQSHHDEVVKTQDALTFGLVTIVEFRDPETGFHVDRLAHYCKTLALELRKNGNYQAISDEFIYDIFRAAPLHDIGKVAIPDSILLKPGPLTKNEFDVMKTHTTLGAQAIEALARKLPNVTFLKMAKDIALSHHEWWNGGGYPLGLRGDDIALPARMLALSDFYDALSFPRVYRTEALTHDEVMKLIEGRRATQFDPLIVEAFLLIHEDFQRIRREFADAPSNSLAREGRVIRL